MRLRQNYLEIPDVDFLTKCNATNKLNYFQKRQSTFGRIDERNYSRCTMVYKIFSKTKYENFVNEAIIVLKKTKIEIFPSGWSLEKDAAWHFDTHKFYGYLRDEYCKPKGVRHISADVHKMMHKSTN